ncbi:MAG: class I SAM-dependent methyltransferase [Alphaproteobacteria bacterium]
MLDDLDRRLPAVQRLGLPPEAVYGMRTRQRPTDMVRCGSVFQCCICGGGYHRFLRFGLDGRRNARCPRCGSLERHRFLWWHAERKGYFDRRQRILHVAPEACIRAHLETRPQLRYTAIDRFDPDAPLAMDLTRLDFAAGRFDLILCSHVLEHVEDDRRAIAEMARVLRPGGRALVMVPMDRRLAQTQEDASVTTPAGRAAAFGHPYHVRICGRDYADRIAAGGFAVATASSTALTPHRRRRLRINRTVLFDCLRK